MAILSSIRKNFNTTFPHYTTKQKIEIINISRLALNGMKDLFQTVFFVVIIIIIFFILVCKILTR
jgi:hypothetical protein